MNKRKITIEIEDKHMRICFARGSGRRSRIERARSFSLKSMAPQNVATAIASASEGLAYEDADVYLAVSDRRIVSGSCYFTNRPRRSDLREELFGEARRVGMFSSAEELKVGFVERAAGAGWHAFLEAAPASTIDEYVAGIEQAGFRNIYMTTIETALGVGLGSQQEGASVAILDLRKRLARLVLVQGSEVLATRKIKMSFLPTQAGGSGIESLFPLSAELARSIEYFRGQELPEVEKVVVVGDMAEGSFDFAAFQDMVGLPCEVGATRILDSLPEDLEAKLGWTLHVLLARGLPKKATPYLVEPVRVSAMQMLSLSGLQVVGAAALAIGVFYTQSGLGSYGNELYNARQQALEDVTSLGAEVARARSALRIPAEVRRRARILETIDRQHASVSRLCARIGESRPEQLLLTRIDLSEDGRLELAGVIRTNERLDAIKKFSELDTGLRSIAQIAGGGGALEDQDPRLGWVPFRYWARFQRRR